VRKPSLAKKARYLIEAGLLLFLLLLFRILPIDLASALGSKLARSIGPKLKWHRTARANLAYIWPHHNTAEREAILTGMWDNLGRTFAEYSWLNSKTLTDRISLSAASHLVVEKYRHHPRSIIFAAGHFANWEIAPLAAHLQGIPLVLIYRHANNPYVDRLMTRIRQPFFAALYPKGRKGAAALLEAIRKKQSIGMLVDQKMNNGIELLFLGKPSMTAPATAELALKYNLPVLLTRIIRTQGSRFTIEVSELLPPQGVTHDERVKEMMQDINTHLTAWIKEHPSQWLWIHRRWKIEG
jgi:Kdo2-lipid IVA lauroyltransferase/acyltransferase